jgi:hypothetical protein
MQQLQGGQYNTHHPHKLEQDTNTVNQPSPQTDATNRKFELK